MDQPGQIHYHSISATSAKGGSPLVEIFLGDSDGPLLMPPTTTMMRRER